MRNTEYKICNDSGEDPTCSDKFLVDLDVLNHLNYLDYDYLTLVLSCQIWIRFLLLKTFNNNKKKY